MLGSFTPYTLIAASVVVGFVLGRLGKSPWRRQGPQNEGEARVSSLLRAHFTPPHYHLLNHVTIRLDDGTTQIDHILVSRFGVFVIETKHFSGWIFGSAADTKWTQVYFRMKSRFQNPILQNFRHICAVRDLLDFLPPGAIKSLVVFSGDAEFKTPLPEGVTTIDGLVEWLEDQKVEVMSLNRLQFCVGRLETARLAISGETDVEHIESLARRFDGSAV